jgi:hypothetical protein
MENKAAQHEPMPVKNEEPCIQDLVIADLQARKAVGIERYGTTLQPFNGRDVLMDLYQEILDAANYLRQAIYERDHAKGAAAPSADSR